MAVKPRQSWYTESCAKNKERWMQLCEQASTEQDPQKLFTIIQEIIRLLNEKEKRLKASRLPPVPVATPVPETPA
jgi:hypothetical protein